MTVISARLDDGVAARLKELGVSVGGVAPAIELLLKAYKGPWPPALDEGELRPPKGITAPDWPWPEHIEVWARLLLPVGEVVCGVAMAWPLPRPHFGLIRDMFVEWEGNGFSLIWGDYVRVNCACPSTRLQPYFIGDRYVWCEIRDADRALLYLVDHTQVLVALKADVEKYNKDGQYAAAVDRYNTCYHHYFKYGSPLEVERVA